MRNRRLSTVLVGGFMNALSTLLGRKVDVVSERALNQYLRDSVLQEAISL